jgi:hypothetical protein
LINSKSKKKAHFINLRKLTKPAALYISALFIFSILLAFSSTAVQAATVPAKVAVSSATASSYYSSHTPDMAINGVKLTWDYWGTDATITAGKLPQWLQLNLGTQTNINQITTHFYDGDSRTYTYYIQASTDGSNWNTIVPTKTGNSIVTDTFTQTTAKYVKITITGNTANLAAHIIEIEIYQSTTSTTTPTPTPSPTLNPAPPSTNLAPIPNAWGFYDSNGGYVNYGPNSWVQITHLDTSVTFNGMPSIRIDAHTSADPNQWRECDTTAKYSVKPGDHVVMSVWIKTGTSMNGDPYGARIGVDFYGAASTNIPMVDGLPSSGYTNAPENFFSGTPYHASTWTSTTGTCTGTNVMFVPWGTSTWTKMTYDFIVPSKYYTQDFSGAGIPSQQIGGMIVWLDARSQTEPASAWFANTELYIN